VLAFGFIHEAIVSTDYDDRRTTTHPSEW
jgi:hypothetical protein